MAMMHLDFPRMKGWLHWDELGCMARALGFPGEIYYNNIPEEFLEEHADENGISIKNILNMMKAHKIFNKAVDKTCNIHTDEWNLCVIEKAIHLLDNHVVTYEDLYRIRMAYQVYENADTKGLLLTEKSLLRTLKMCSRQISPLKMMHRIKHMRDHFEEDGRIQLHEFLDLILWCEVSEQVKLEAPNLDCTKSEDALYRLNDFETLLKHYDETLHERLNTEYKAEELTFVKEKHGSRKMPKDVPPVDPEVRKRQVAYHKEKYTFMQNELMESARSCHQAKAGKVRDRPITAPDLLLYHELEASMRVSTLDPRPATVYDTIGHLIRPLTRQSTVALSDVKRIVPRPDVSRYKRPMTPSAVKKHEKQEHEHIMEALDFEMATVEHKYEQLLMEEIDAMMPGYREKMAKRAKIQPPPVEEKSPPREPRPSQETLERLAYHQREGPRPAHSKNCDARFRGWHKARVRRGSHYILIAPSFEQSDVGRQLDKLRKTSLQEGKLDKYVQRVTTKENQIPDKPKSRAKKVLAPLDLENGDSHGSPPAPLRESTRIWEPGESGPPSSRGGGGSKKSGGGGGKLTKEGKNDSHRGSKNSLKSTGRSSDVSWHHLRIYADNDPEKDMPKASPKTPLESLSREKTLEAIKEESGRNTRISGANKSRASNKLATELPQRSKTVQVQTPHTLARNLVKDQSAPTSGAELLGPNRKQRVVLERLATRVDGMVSLDLQHQIRGMDPNRPVTVC